MRKLIRVSLLTVLVVIAGAGGWVIYQHDYDLREEKVTITGGEHPLRGSWRCRSMVTGHTG